MDSNYQINHVPSAREAIKIQQKLASKVNKHNHSSQFHLIAAADISVRRFTNEARGAIVVVSYPGLEIRDVSITSGKIYFPYIPGLLSFREIPLLLASFEKLTTKPDLLLVDGQGIAHPRRFGLASHLGIILDIPSIGCAKSLLCGTHDTPGNIQGDYAKLYDHNTIIGAAVRTKNNTKPVYVSVGHKINLAACIKWVLHCCTRYRIPQPLRLAHLYANDILTDTRSRQQCI